MDASCVPDSTKQRTPVWTIFARLGVAFCLWLLAEAALCVAGIAYGFATLAPESGSWGLFDIVVCAFRAVLVGAPFSAGLALWLAWRLPLHRPPASANAGKSN